MFAAMKGDVQLLHTILKHKPNVNLKDTNNRNALFYAIDSGKGDNADVVMSLIGAGINVNEIEKLKGHSPLSLATSKNLKSTVKVLLDCGAFANHVVESSGNTPLHYAVQNASLEMVRMLIGREANINVINNDNLSPIQIALGLTSTDIYKVLVEEINRRDVKENEIVKDLMMTEQLQHATGTSSNKKKKKEIINVNKDDNIVYNNENEPTNTANNANNAYHDNNENEFTDIKKHINYSSINKKIKKPTKIEFIEFIKEKNKKNKNMTTNITPNRGGYNLEIPFSFNRTTMESTASLNSFIRRDIIF
jgi:ankyrin repeat protein